MNEYAKGYNPIRHDCGRHGCYLTECHPKAEWFASCFPGKISFSDMDRIVERNGRALVMEWKGAGGALTQGQEIMWAKLTRGTMLTAVAVNGDPKTMEVSAYRICWNGKWEAWVSCGITDLYERIKAWATWAETHPVFSVTVNGRFDVGEK